MNILQASVGVLWIINIGLLIAYMVQQEVNGWNITALVGVALTGIVPMLRAAYNKYTGKDDNKQEGWTPFIHVISGVIGTAGSGLALGYAARCDKSSYDHIELLIIAAVVNGLSCIIAHIAYIEKPAADYGNSSAFNHSSDGGKVGSLELGRSSWIFYICLLSLVCLVGHVEINSNSSSNYEHVCTNTDHYMWYLLSPVVHFAAFSLLWLSIGCECIGAGLLYSIYTVAGVLSMFGAMITHGYWGDILLTIVVYLYLAGAHLL